jgi:hypothetical protein
MTASPFVEGSERPEYGDPHDGAAVVRCWLVEPVPADSFPFVAARYARRAKKKLPGHKANGLGF